MSFESYIFCNRRLESVAEWQHHLDNANLPITLSSNRDLTSDKGHLPATWNGIEAGFEFGPIDPSDVLENYREFNFGGPWKFVFVLYWGIGACCMAAPAVAAAYARAVDGVVFEAQDGLVVNGDEAFAYARLVEAQWPELQQLISEL